MMFESEIGGKMSGTSRSNQEMRVLALLDHVHHGHTGLRFKQRLKGNLSRCEDRPYKRRRAV